MRRQLLGFLLCFALVGCSAKQKIYNTAESVRQDAISIEQNAVEIQSITDDPVVSGLAGEIVSDSQSIQRSAETVKQATTKVRDIIPWWAQLIKWILGVAVLVALAYFTWVYIVPIRAIIGRFIPRRKSEASMLRKMDAGEVRPQEFIARWRADPANEGAYQAVKRKEALRAGKP